MALIQPFGLVQDDEATRAKDDVDARKRDQRAQESEEEGAVPTPAAGRRDAVVGAVITGAGFLGGSVVLGGQEQAVQFTVPGGAQ